MRALLLFFIVLSACTRPQYVVGEECEINSDCVDPLICALGACRRQCVDSRDCGAGSVCLRDDDSPLGGGCQLEHERVCTLTSQCRHPSQKDYGLICQNGTCTTPCVEDRDCVDGAMCTTDDSETIGCYESQTESCLYASDCPEPMICDVNQVCRLECMGDVDCTRPRMCIRHLCELPPN